jgi:hypothetical protein
VWLGWRGSSGGFHLSTAAFGSGRVPHVRPSVHGPKTIFQMLSLHARGQSWSETADLSYPRICSNSELANATTLYPQST